MLRRTFWRKLLVTWALRKASSLLRARVSAGVWNPVLHLPTREHLLQQRTDKSAQHGELYSLQASRGLIIPVAYCCGKEGLHVVWMDFEGCWTEKKVNCRGPPPGWSRVSSIDSAVGCKMKPRLRLWTMCVVASDLKALRQLQACQSQ